MFGIIFAAIGTLFYGSFGTVVGLCLAAVAALLLVFPCVNGKEATDTVQKEVDKMQKPPGHSFKLSQPNLDDWTWHVPVQRTSLNSITKFCMDVSSKRRGHVKSQHNIE